jgi:dihydropteroate synthase
MLGTGRGLAGQLDRTASQWRLRTKTIHFGRLPTLMGIVNVTPDSFSDGGQFLDTSSAIDHALRLAEQGAEILDIGGESTRPYSNAVTASEELDRVLPVVEQLCENASLIVSVDTSKAVVAEAALDAGAELINDVTGLQGDPKMIDVIRRFGAGVCAMHMRGTPQTMQEDPTYDDVVHDVFQFLQQRKNHLIQSGIQADKICLDPGIGFGKTHYHNLQLVRHCKRLHLLGSPILIGHSRKGFIGKAIGDNAADRRHGTNAVTLWLARQGIQVIRVHDVDSAHQALKVFDAIGGIDGTLAGQE